MKKMIIIILAIVLIIGVSPHNQVEAVGGSASLNPTSEKITLKDRPKVISTRPRNGERYFDPERLRRFVGDPEEGYYLEVVFENIGGTLGLVNNLPVGITMKIEGDDENKVDESRELKFTSIQKGLYYIYP